MTGLLEEFCKNNQHTINALIAIGTFAAVWVALTSSKIKLKASLCFYKHENSEDSVLFIRIKNNGLTSAFINKGRCFYLRISPSKHKFLPGNTVGIHRQEIRPGDGENVILESVKLSDLVQAIELEDKCWCRRIKSKFRLRWLLYVVTLDGSNFRLKIDESLKNKLKDL